MRVLGLTLVLGVGVLFGACGGDDEPEAATTPAPATQATTAAKPPTAEEQITALGDKWAPLFAAADPAACELMAEEAKGACETVFTPPPGELQQSFDGQTVRDVKVKGDRAGAKFTGGNTIELIRFPDAEPGEQWNISNVGGDAGKTYFR